MKNETPFDTRKIIVALRDSRSCLDVVILKHEHDYEIWLQIDVGGMGECWEPHGQKYRTLNEAMNLLANIIEQNIQNDFYEAE